MDADSIAWGPFYPEPFQAAVNHAERLAAAVDAALEDVLRARAYGRSGGVDAEIWLRGRADEMQAFVRDVANDWRLGLLSPEDAASAVDVYLESVHRGMLSRVAWGRPLDCCLGVDGCVTREAKYDSATRVPAMPPVRASSDGDTKTPADGTC